MSTSANKKILKNSIYLYLRLLIVMPISFFTVRIILKELGVDNYGIYAATAGVIAFFSSLRSTFANATQRYLNFAMGKGCLEEMKSIYNTSLIIHIFIALILVMIVECFGLWFIFNKMVFPEGRLISVIYCFECAIISMVFIIMSVPYNAIIIAYERMHYYAFLAVLEVAMKLFIAFTIILFSGDRLFIYATAMTCLDFLMFILAVVYCRKNFLVCKISKKIDMVLLRKMFSFAGWSYLGNITYSLVNEGSNLLLNLFGGVAANAARGIAYSIKSMIMQLYGNSTTAIRPNATQEFSKGNMERFFRIVIFSSKIFGILAGVMCMSVYFFSDMLLRIWLGDIPMYAVVFTQIIALQLIIRSFHSPLDMIFVTTGNLKWYQILNSAITILVLSTTYLLLKQDFPVTVVFWGLLVLEFMSWGAMLFLAQKEGLSLLDYTKKVILPVGFVCLINYLFGFYLIGYFSHLNELLSFVLFISCTTITSAFIGINKSDLIIIKSTLCKNER